MFDALSTPAVALSLQPAGRFTVAGSPGLVRTLASCPPFEPVVATVQLVGVAPDECSKFALMRVPSAVAALAPFWVMSK